MRPPKREKDEREGQRDRERESELAHDGKWIPVLCVCVRTRCLCETVSTASYDVSGSFWFASFDNSILLLHLERPNLPPGLSSSLFFARSPAPGFQLNLSGCVFGKTSRKNRGRDSMAVKGSLSLSLSLSLSRYLPILFSSPTSISKADDSLREDELGYDPADETSRKYRVIP